jgi:hypothetical protein
VTGAGVAGLGAGVVLRFDGTSTFGTLPVLVRPGVVGVVSGGATVAAGGGVVAGGVCATCASDVAGGTAGSLRSAA